MAYVNVLEWKSEQVSEWLRGLDDSIFPYAHFFLNNNITGQGLLNLTVDDLYKLHVEKLGHQELILESLELLKQLHFSLDQENLQYVSLKLSCKSRSLYNEIQMRFPQTIQAATLAATGHGSSNNSSNNSNNSNNNSTPVKQVVTGAIMSQVGDVLDSVKCLLSWLERKPFQSKEEFIKVRTTLIGLSLELATNTHREAFAERPIDVIRDCCDKLGELSDQVIQEVRDPLLLQPASLDVATLRKKADEELGIVVEGGQIGGVHLVTEVNVINPSARIQPGDEIVQVNYQTVVGWQTKKVIQLMGENPGEVILTLKKRPKHGNLMGQVYMKPFRIPARNKNKPNLLFNNLPSPRTELLVVPDLSIPIPKKRPETRVSSCSSVSEDEADATGDNVEDSDSENDEAFLPVVAAEVADQIQGARSGCVGGAGGVPGPGGAQGAQVSPTSSLRSVLSRPRSAPQRRATISGTMPRSRPNINVGEGVYVGGGIDSSMLEISYSTLSSQDSGVSTMSAKQEFAMRNHHRGDFSGSGSHSCGQRPKTLAAPLSAAALHQVTSAPNLHSISDARFAAQQRLQQQDSSPDTSLAEEEESIGEINDDYGNGDILENVEYRNGSLNIEVKSPIKSRSPKSLPHTQSNSAQSYSPQSLPMAQSPPQMMVDRMSGERIILKVPSPPSYEKTRRASSSSATTSPQPPQPPQAYMNVPRDEEVNSSLVTNTPAATGRLKHPYVNIPHNLVQSNPLSKPGAAEAPALPAQSWRRTSQDNSGAWSPSHVAPPASPGGSTSAGGSSPPPTPPCSANPSPASTGSRTGTRGKRPVPLPRRVSTGGGSTAPAPHDFQTLPTNNRTGHGSPGGGVPPSTVQQRQRSNTTSGGGISIGSAGGGRQGFILSGGAETRRDKSSAQQFSQSSRDKGSTSTSITSAESSATTSSTSSGGSRASTKGGNSSKQVAYPGGAPGTGSGPSGRRSGSATRGSGRESLSSIHRSSPTKNAPQRSEQFSPGGRGPQPPQARGSGTGFTQITPTSNYKSYRRLPPTPTAPAQSGMPGFSPQSQGERPAAKVSESQSSKATSPTVNLEAANRFRSSGSSSELHRSGSSTSQQSGMPNHSLCSTGPTRLDDQGYVEISEIVGATSLCQGNNVNENVSPRKKSSSSRMASVSSTDSGLPDSISTSLPPTPKHKLPPPPNLPPAPTVPALPPSLPALPPRRHPSTSS